MNAFDWIFLFQNRKKYWIIVHWLYLWTVSTTIHRLHWEHFSLCLKNKWSLWELLKSIPFSKENLCNYISKNTILEFIENIKANGFNWGREIIATRGQVEEMRFNIQNLTNLLGRFYGHTSWRDLFVICLLFVMMD